MAFPCKVKAESNITLGFHIDFPISFPSTLSDKSGVLSLAVFDGLLLISGQNKGSAVTAWPLLYICIYHNDKDHFVMYYQSICIALYHSSVVLW